MKRETLLTVAVIALLLLNFGTLGFLLLRRPPHPDGPGGPGRFGRHIVEQLHLTTEQQRQFEQLKSAHHEQMLASDRAYRDALQRYFALLKNDEIPVAQRDSLLAQLAQIQQTKATVTFQHFADLKALCTPEQQADFEALLPDLMQVIAPERGRAGRGQNRD